MSLLRRHILTFLAVLLMTHAAAGYCADKFRKMTPVPLKSAPEAQDSVKKKALIPVEKTPALQPAPKGPAVEIQKDDAIHQLMPKDEPSEVPAEEEYKQGDEYLPAGEGWYYGDESYYGGGYYYPDSGQGYGERPAQGLPLPGPQKFRGVGGSLLQQQRFQFREDAQGVGGGASTESRGPLQYEDKQVLVATSTMDDARVVQQSITAAGFRIKSRRQLSQLGMVLTIIRPSPEYSIPDAVTALQQAFPQVLVAPNHVYRLLKSMDAGNAFAKGMTGWPRDNSACRSRLRIGLIDTEVDTYHEVLKGASIQSRSMVTSGIARAPAEHGTAIAALLAGRSASGRWQGLLNGANIYAVDVFRRDGKDIRTNAEWLLQALDALLTDQVAVINVSLGGPHNDLLHHAVRTVLGRQVIMVAAVGDSGATSAPVYPAGYPGVIAVTAADANKRVHGKANSGEHVDFTAPGVAVWSARAKGGGDYFTGSSYATPFITAAMAILRNKHPKESSDRITQRLADNAIDLGKPGRDPVYGWGLLNASGLCGQDAR